MAVRRRIREGDGDPRHGSLGGYTNHECRCPLCTEAQRQYAETKAHDGTKRKATA